MNASYNEIYSTGILNSREIKGLMDATVSKVTPNMLKNHGIRIISLNDGEYPESLKEIYDPPVALFVKGKIPAGRKIAVVGSRKCTGESRLAAYRAAALLAEKGICIVSGMAKGIDAASHWGALERGGTIAVLGNGPDICYPSENRLLKERIEKTGCIISEYPPGKSPTKYSFPARNRIISGLSESVIVAEAAKRSGALITVDFALDEGKDVYILSNNGRIFGEGVRKLQTEGAITVDTECITDIINR